MLSAFGLCLSYEKNTPSWLSFMKKRISKIAVAYWIMILYYVVYEMVRAVLAGGSLFSRINFRGVLVNALFLNGLYPDDFINNNIVSSGWFIGTLVLIYAMFPLLFTIYNCGNAKWRKIRSVIFPAGMFAVSFITINVAGLFEPNLSVSNPFVYRFVLNQLPCFAVGFFLYDLYRNKKLHMVKLPLVLFLIFASSGAVLFYLENSWNGSVFPFLFAVSSFFLYIVLSRSKGLIKCLNSEKCRVVVAFSRMGENSLHIYMVQSIVNFYLVDGFIYLMKPFCNNNLYLYLISLPAILLLSVYSGIWFARSDKFIRKFIKR